MKKLFIFIKLMLLATLISFSQNSSNADIKATANLIGRIEVSKVQDLRFGDIEYDVSTIVPTNLETGSRGRGLFEIIAGPGNPNVTLEFDLPTELDHLGSGNGLSIGNYTYIIENTNVTTSVGSPIPASPINLNLASFGSPGMDKHFYVFVGATVVPNINNFVGPYEGTITLTVTYK